MFKKYKDLHYTFPPYVTLYSYINEYINDFILIDTNAQHILDNGSIALAKFQHFCCLEFNDLDFNSDTKTIILCDRNINNIVHALFSFCFSYSTACILNFLRIIIQREYLPAICDLCGVTTSEADDDGSYS